ncbi:hypothetical protein K503DRAFT_551737 [Rhizopogon vinicolor AM-OR11-026]|uniref:Uncharacterized protein n=1 Tax=Rhizopogon vinicolor AM-OR11-026 TaxID=1314800 RepID=A0A1B7MKJ7_9AGAM|nr:hypothetical protein K503DRAFT_551737 [Rhizopogon vinicolor AM-OR11-026]
MTPIARRGVFAYLFRYVDPDHYFPRLASSPVGKSLYRLSFPRQANKPCVSASRSRVNMRLTGSFDEIGELDFVTHGLEQLGHFKSDHTVIVTRPMTEHGSFNGVLLTTTSHHEITSMDVKKQARSFRLYLTRLTRKYEPRDDVRLALSRKGTRSKSHESKELT